MLACTPGAAAQVELRRGGTIGTKVLEVSDAGVLVEDAVSSTRQMVGWERIKLVIGEKATDAQAFAPAADKAWRAVERLRRGDVAASEPLFDELYRTYQGKRGPTAAVVSEGLARCRMARGAVAAAVVPWLNTIGAKSAPEAGTTPAEWVGGAIESAGFVDAEYLLCPALPPVWLRGAALDALAASPAWTALKNEPGPAGELAALYEIAATLQSDESRASEASTLLDAVPTTDSPGTSLVRQMLLARFGAEDERESARALLQALIDGAFARPRASTEARTQTPRWVEAWCRFAIGESLAHEDDERTRLQGVIELLHLPSRFASDQAYLAGLALADSAFTLADIGDASGAGVLKHEALTKYPRHPAVAQERLRGIKAIAPRPEEE